MGGISEVGDDGVSVGLEGFTGDRPPPRLKGKGERADGPCPPLPLEIFFSLSRSGVRSVTDPPDPFRLGLTGGWRTPLGRLALTASEV